jgi:thioredoxin reductase (NADPH)
MSTPRTVRVAIIGSGPAGWTAAIYAARALLQPVVIAGLQPGGQLTITTDVENYPGFADVIQGPWLMEQMRAQAEHVGTEIIEDIVVKADLSQRPFRLTLDSGTEMLAETVIISTGAQAKWLGLESEAKYQGFGVSACATCDGFFYRGKDVIVVGGGNTAVEEALFLTNFASKVTVVHRRDEFRAEKILQERLLSNPKVEVVWDSAIDEILGETNDFGGVNVTGARIKNVKTGETRDLAADGVFIAIGHAPSSELFAGQLETKQGGYLVVKPGTAATAIEGVWAAGDVTDDIYRQAGYGGRHGLYGCSGGGALFGGRGSRQGQSPDQPQGSGEDRGLVGRSGGRRPGGLTVRRILARIIAVLGQGTGLAMHRFGQQIDIGVQICRRLGQQKVQLVDLAASEAWADHVPTVKIAMGDRAAREDLQIPMAVIDGQAGQQVFQPLVAPFEDLHKSTAGEGEHAGDVVARIIPPRLSQNVGGADRIGDLARVDADIDQLFKRVGACFQRDCHALQAKSCRPGGAYSMGRPWRRHRAYSTAVSTARSSVGLVRTPSAPVTPLRTMPGLAVMNRTVTPFS